MGTTGQLYVALLRGINVGGKNRLPMKELISILEELGCQHVKTYVQSGNAVFEAAAEDAPFLAERIAGEIRGRRGFAPYVLLLTLEDIERATAENPFPDAETNPSRLHVGFLGSQPDRPKLDQMEGLRSGSERFRLTGRALYLHAPDGVARSKLAASAEKLLGVPMTDRNWTTVLRIRDMARDLLSST